MIENFIFNFSNQGQNSMLDTENNRIRQLEIEMLQVCFQKD